MLVPTGTSTLFERLILEFLSQTNLTLMISGMKNTYQKENKDSKIDLMFANDALNRHIKKDVSDMYRNNGQRLNCSLLMFAPGTSRKRYLLGICRAERTGRSMRHNYA